MADPRGRPIWALAVCLLALSSAACGHPTPRADDVTPPTVVRDASVAPPSAPAQLPPQRATHFIQPASLADAQAIAPFPLQVPAAIPAGYRLDGIAACCFAHLPPPNDDPLVACMQGTATVWGQPAVWQKQ